MYSREFEEAWSIYPRKIGKALAFKKFNQALKRARYETIINGIAGYKDYTAGTEQRFICHLSTWLNQDRWNDDYAALICDNRRKSQTGNSMAAAVEVVQKNIEKSSMERGWDINGDDTIFYIPSSR